MSSLHLFGSDFSSIILMPPVFPLRTSISFKFDKLILKSKDCVIAKRIVHTSLILKLLKNVIY